MKIQPKYLHIKIREARGAMTQKTLAEKIGVTPGAISQWECEDPQVRTVPTLENLMAVAKVTGQPIGWFIDCEVNLVELSKALRLANAIDHADVPFGNEAAAELRRLDAVETEYKIFVESIGQNIKALKAK